LRPFFALSALALSLGLALPARAADPAPSDKLDHVLLWGRDIDQATAVLAVKLGFQVRPGRNPGGVANRYVRLADQGYLELLGVTRPDPEMDPGMQADQASHGGAGSRSFGLHAACAGPGATGWGANSERVVDRRRKLEATVWGGEWVCHAIGLHMSYPPKVVLYLP